MPSVMSKISSAGSKGKFTELIIVPVIPLEREDSPNLVPGEYYKYKMRTNPTNDKSQTYELEIVTFGEGTPECWLKTRRAILEVIHRQNVRQNVMNYNDQCIPVCKMLKGQAKTAFGTSVVAQELLEKKSKEDKAKDPTVYLYMPNIEYDLQEVARTVFPLAAEIRHT